MNDADRKTTHPFFSINQSLAMKSQVLQTKSTPVARQLLPLRVSRPCSVRLRQPRFASSLDGLLDAPGTLPVSLLRIVR